MPALVLLSATHPIVQEAQYLHNSPWRTTVCLHVAHALTCAEVGAFKQKSGTGLSGLPSLMPQDMRVGSPVCSSRLLIRSSANCQAKGYGRMSCALSANKSFRGFGYLDVGLQNWWLSAIAIASANSKSKRTLVGRVTPLQKPAQLQLQRHFQPGKGAAKFHHQAQGRPRCRQAP
jgi:hypothetical protein